MSRKGKLTPKWNLAFSRIITVGLHRAKVARAYKGTPSLLRQLLERKHRGSRQRSDNTHQMSHAPMLSRNMMYLDIGQLGFISVVWRVMHYLTWMKSMKTYDTWQWKLKCGAWSCHKRDNPMLKWRVQQERTHRFPRVLVHAKNKKTTSGCNERIIFLGCKTQKDN